MADAKGSSSSQKRGRASTDRVPARRFRDALPEPVCTQLLGFLPPSGAS